MKKLIVGLGILSTAILLICASGLIYASNLKPVEPPKTPNTLNATIVFNLVNKEREMAGLKPLARDARLDATAQAKVDDMVARNYFSHFDPVTGTNTVWDNPIWKELCVHSSENIIFVNEIGNKNTDAINWWMNSKPHHDAILNPNYTLAGMAVNGNKGTMHFCIAK